MFNKKGLSAVVATLMIILLVLIAIGIIWVVVKNVITEGSEQVSIDKFSLDLKIKNAMLNDETGELNVVLERGAGKGELKGINFVLFDGTSSEVVEVLDSAQSMPGELETKTFSVAAEDLEELEIDKIIKVSVAPIFESSSGEKQIEDIIAERVIGECTDTCGDLECGTVCGTSCGTCEGGYSCNQGQCEETPCEKDCTNLQCGLDPICGESCGSCSEPETCQEGICKEPVVPKDCNVDGSASSTGVTCSGAGEDETSATIDSCGDKGGTFTYVDNIELDKSKFSVGEEITVACKVHCFYIGSTYYKIFYKKNSGDWNEISSGACQGGGENYKEFFAETFTIEEGDSTQYVRCASALYNPSYEDGCSSAMYVDHDDLDFIVE